MENERENEITYRKEGDYYVTNLVIPRWICKLYKSNI